MIAAAADASAADRRSLTLPDLRGAARALRRRRPRPPRWRIITWAALLCAAVFTAAGLWVEATVWALIAYGHLLIEQAGGEGRLTPAQARARWVAAVVAAAIAVTNLIVQTVLLVSR